MSRAFLVLCPLLASLFAGPVRAQVDAASTVLLRPTGKSASKQNLDSSRYKIRAPESRKDDDEIGEKPGTVIPTPVSKAKTKTTTTAEITVPASSEPVPSPVPPEAVAVSPTPAPTPVADAAPAEPPPVTQQVRDLIMGGTQEDISEARTQIHPQDPRANVLDIQLAPAYYYNSSQSGYSYRRYSSHGPGLGLGMNLWLTPFFGLQSRFFSSVSASVRSGGTNMVPTDVQSFEAGIRFRKHFGYSRKAAHMNWGLDYHDEINKINSEATTIIGRKSSGLGVSLETVVPSSNTYAHTLQVDVRPRLKHTEMNTGVEVKSGNKAETNAIGLGVGGQWLMDRRNQVFWKAQYSVERNLFKGQASQADPHTGIAPDGVSVTNSLMMFYFGFRWGS